MINGPDLDQLVKEPSLLIKLCREVIDRIDNGSKDSRAGEKEAQLREIAKAIERLENMGVAVPDSLRAEKTHLAAALSVKTEIVQAMDSLIKGFEALVEDLKSRIGHLPKQPPPKRSGNRRSASGTKQTPQSELISYILDALNELGGSAHCNDVLDLMEQKLQGKLLPGDFEDDSSHRVKWRHNAHWARLKLANDGILVKDSPRGYWQLSKRQR